MLKEKLETIDKQSTVQRKSREDIVRVSLVGYTNVGKSTLMNLISKSDVFAENKLFATLDSTVRKVVFNTIPFLLTDTVGFIRKLPTTLIESFKSTLDEIREADILVHVVDVSHQSFEDQMETVNKTLGEIGAADKPTILVFNKIDLLKEKPADEDPFDEASEDRPLTIEELKATYLNDANKNTVFISAEKRLNIEELRKILSDMVAEKHYTIFPNYLKNEIY